MNPNHVESSSLHCITLPSYRKFVCPGKSFIIDVKYTATEERFIS